MSCDTGCLPPPKKTKKKHLSCDEERKGGCLGVRAQFCWGPLAENEMPCFSTISLQLLRASALRDANCFCYLCQVPTLPRHILQTGPGPSAAFCVCLRNEKKKKQKKKKGGWPKQTSAPLFPPPGRAVQGWQREKRSHALSEVERKCAVEKQENKTWHVQPLIWNKIIQEVPVLMHLTRGVCVCVCVLGGG